MCSKFNSFYSKKLILSVLLVLLGSCLLACGETVSPTVLSLAPTATQPAPTQQPSTPARSLPTATASVPTTVAPATATLAPVPTTLSPTNAPATPTNPAATTMSGINPSDTAVIHQGLGATFSGTLVMAHLTELAGNIGPRVAGTAAERKAGDYIEKHFQQIGLTVTRPGFQVSTTADKGSQLSFKNSTKQTIEIKGNAFNMSANAKVNAPLVFANYGRKSDLPLGGLQGRVALVERGEIPFEEKVLNVTQAGAVGIVVYNNLADQPLKGTLVTQATIPALGISKTDGATLRDELITQSTFPLNLEVNVTTQSTAMTNIVGTRPATTGAAADAPILIIGGHYDSVPDSPGANDNASGTAIVMELARILKNRYTHYELRFIAFAGEEIGLTGSADYAKKLSAAERSRIKAMINIDMVAVGNTFLVGGDVALVRMAQTAALSLGAGNVQVMPPAATGGSDNYSFQQINIPTLFFNRESDPNYHRFSDSVDKVKPEHLVLVGQSVTQVIDALTKN